MNGENYSKRKRGRVNQNHQELVVLLTSEQDQGKDEIDAKNKEIENMKNHKLCEHIPIL